MALTNTRIDYLTHTWGYVVGCERGCSYCYARNRVAPRLKCPLCRRYVPHFHLERLEDPLKRKKPARIGLGFLSDFFGRWRWTDPEGVSRRGPRVRVHERAFEIMRQTPQHRYVVLTKDTYGIPQTVDFPENLWIGASVTGAKEDCAEELERLGVLFDRVPVERSIISLEPMEGERLILDIGADFPAAWWIVGGRTGRGAHGLTKYSAEKVMMTADFIRCPVWFKGNCRLLGLPQDMPAGLVLPWEKEA